MQNLAHQIQTALKTLHTKIHNVCKAERQTYLTTQLTPTQGQIKIVLQAVRDRIFYGSTKFTKMQNLGKRCSHGGRTFVYSVRL